MRRRAAGTRASVGNPCHNETMDSYEFLAAHESTDAAAGSVARGGSEYGDRLGCIADEQLRGASPA